MKSFHNTTNELDQLPLFERKAATQEDKVLAFFESYPNGIATPSQIHERVLSDAPLTSARRAISNLTRAGKLARTDRKFRGPYGRLEYAWRLL